MSYGDGMAALIGKRYGKNKYQILGDEKSFEGSIGMFLILILSLTIVLYYYHVPTSNFIIIPIVAFVATIFERITPRGLDNITACFSAVGTYLLLIMIGL